MPLCLAPFVTAWFGVVLAWTCRRTLRRHVGSIWASRPMRVVLGYATLVLLPTLAAVPIVVGDWGYLYVVPWASIPSALDLVFVLLGAAATPLAFASIARHAAADRVDRIFLALAGLATPILAGLLFAFRRIATVCTYAQFHGQFAERSVVRSAPGLLLLFAWVLWVVGLVTAARTLRDEHS